MRMRLGKRKPIGFRFLCWVPFIEVFPLGSQPPGTKPAVTGRSDRAIVNDIIPFGRLRTTLALSALAIRIERLNRPDRLPRQ
jgi:hypothetical protein